MLLLCWGATATRCDKHCQEPNLLVRLLRLYSSYHSLPMRKKSYPVGWRSHIAPIIRAHYNFTCIICGDTRAALHVHHIDRDTDNNSFHNLIPLCPKCHRKAEFGQFSFCQLSRGGSDAKVKESSDLLEQVDTMLRAEGNKPMLQSSKKPRKQ